MTPKKLSECLEAFADAIDNPLIADCVKGLANVLKTIQVPKELRLSEVVASRLANAPLGSSKPTVGEVVDVLRPLHRVLTIVSTPKAKLQVSTFFILLEQNEEMSFSMFLSRASTPSGEPSPTVGRYLEDLQGAVANPDSFERAMVRLTKDKQLTPEEVSDIASGFTGLRKKWGRKAALDAIWAKHNAHIKAVTSFSAANGKSAA